MALEMAGWRIDPDPQAGLTVHDVAEFFPEIETDPDHGIDWFRFDISGEMAGKHLASSPTSQRPSRKAFLCRPLPFTGRPGAGCRRSSFRAKIPRTATSVFRQTVFGKFANRSPICSEAVENQVASTDLVRPISPTALALTPRKPPAPSRSSARFLKTSPHSRP